MSFRQAKPTGKQALAEGQEERPRSGTLFQIWDSEDVAFRSLNLAPKAVPAFGKKSQFCVRPWSCLSLLPALTPCRGTLCDLVLRGPLLPPASPAISFPPLGPVPAPGHSQSLPQTSSRALNHWQAPVLALPRLIRVLLYLCVCAQHLSSPAMPCALRAAGHRCTRDPRARKQVLAIFQSYDE